MLTGGWGKHLPYHHTHGFLGHRVTASESEHMNKLVPV